MGERGVEDRRVRGRGVLVTGGWRRGGVGKVFPSVGVVSCISDTNLKLYRVCVNGTNLQ